MDSTQNGPSYSSSAALEPEKSANAQSRELVSIWGTAFFSPSLDPVLEGGIRHKHPVITPQMPTGRFIGEAVLDHEAYRQVDAPMRVLALGRRQGRGLGVAILAALAAVMLRVRQCDLPRTPRDEIPDIVQHAGEDPIAIAALPAT